MVIKIWVFIMTRRIGKLQGIFLLQAPPSGMRLVKQGWKGVKMIKMMP